MHMLLNNDYIIGLVDGEGSFTAFVRNPKQTNKTRKRRVIIEPRFYVKLIEDDKDVLYELKKFSDVEMFTLKKINDQIISTVIVMKWQIEKIYLKQ